MKIRIEERGIHYYDRVSGYHILLDEIQPPPESHSVAPSLVSIALTNICDLACSFCYAPKNKDSLEIAKVINWCKELDNLGTLEIAFGGGEPTLYPQLAELCHELWSNTSLGLSITTHGQHLTANLCSELSGNVSTVRVSIDSIDEYYSEIRGRSFSTVKNNIKTATGFMPVAVNTVVNSNTLPRLYELASMLKSLGIVDWLLLPETVNGVFTLSPELWLQLDHFINCHANDFQIGVTFEARKFLPESPFLFDTEPDNDYVHISADGYLRNSSYSKGGIDLNKTALSSALYQIHLR